MDSQVQTDAPQRPKATRIGVVTSHTRDKTIRVSMDFSVRHAKYGKYMRRRTVLHAHDENNDARTGDTVEIVECRPLSRTKSWTLVRVVQRAPQQVSAAQATGATR